MAELLLTTIIQSQRRRRGLGPFWGPTALGLLTFGAFLSALALAAPPIIFPVTALNANTRSRIL